MTLKLAILMVASLPEPLSKISPMIGYVRYAALEKTCLKLWNKI